MVEQRGTGIRDAISMSTGTLLRFSICVFGAGFSLGFLFLALRQGAATLTIVGLSFAAAGLCFNAAGIVSACRHQGPARAGEEAVDE